jgi:cytosine permease
MMVGAGIASQVGPTVALPAVLAGSLVVYVLGAVHGLEALRTRTAMGMGVRRVFGSGAPSALFTLAIVVAMIGWCGFYLGIGGAALSDLLSVDQIVGALLLGVVCTALALLGQNTWNGLVYLTAGSAVALTLVTVTAISGTPPADFPSPSFWEGVITGVGGVVAYAIVFTMRTPDFTVDLEAPRDVWLAGLTMLLPLAVVLSIGIWLYGHTGLVDLAGVLRRTERPEAGQLFLALSAIAPAVTVIYSSAISIESIRRLRHEAVVLAIAGSAFVLGAIRFDLKLVAFLQALGAVVPSALTVMLLHPRLDPAPTPVLSLSAWVAGSACALAVRPIEPFWGFVVGAVVTASAMFVFSAVHRRKKSGTATRGEGL